MKKFIMVEKIYKFYSDTCAPCKMLTSLLRNTESKGLIENVDVSKRLDLVRKFNIRKVPTLVFVDEKGEHLFSSVGIVTSAEFEKLIKDIQDGSREMEL